MIDLFATIKAHKKNPDLTDVQFPFYLTTIESKVATDHKWDDVKS